MADNRSAILRDIGRLYREWAALPRGRRSGEARFFALELARRALLPGYVLTEYSKAWFEDDAFFRALRRFEPNSDRSADRKYLLRSLLALVAELPGDTAEAGVYRGASSWLICEALAGAGKTHHAFDSFEGLSAPGAWDHGWRAGELRGDEASVRALLEPYGARVHKGWIPASFDGSEVQDLCFAHVDVDLYEPTVESMRFFYPRLVPGGMILCDDYGFTTCAGARRAIDEFMTGRSEPLIHLPTGQALMVKR
jgi:O-methyltransferase